MLGQALPNGIGEGQAQGTHSDDYLSGSHAGRKGNVIMTLSRH